MNAIDLSRITRALSDVPGPIETIRSRFSEEELDTEPQIVAVVVSFNNGDVECVWILPKGESVFLESDAMVKTTRACDVDDLLSNYVIDDEDIYDFNWVIK